MRNHSINTRRCLLAIVVFAAFFDGGCGCNQNPGPTTGPLPAPPAATYAEIVSTFTIATIALQTDDPDHTLTYLTKMVTIAPDEPAGWADLGLQQLRTNQLDAAAKSLDRAQHGAPPTAGIEKLLGLLADRKGDLTGAIAHYREAIRLTPDDARARFAMVTLLERQNSPESYQAAQEAAQAIIDRHPSNLVALAFLTRLAAKRGDVETLKKAIGMLDARAGTFNAESARWLGKVKAAVAAGDTRQAALNTQILQNTLQKNPDWMLSYGELGPRRDDPAGDPVFQFVRLPAMPAVPSPPDMAMSFQEAPIAKEMADTQAGWSGIVYLDSAGGKLLSVADGRNVRFDKGAPLAFPGNGPGSGPLAPSPHGVLPIDVNYDQKNDLVFAGAGGVKIYMQKSAGAFEDVTAHAGLPSTVLTASYSGAWPLDVEADGDLDVLLGSASGSPIVLRNSVDGTWTIFRPFAGVSGVRDFAWADIDGDGSADAIIVDGSGDLRVFMNGRAGIFTERKAPDGLGKVAAIAAADTDRDGLIDVVALQSDGALIRISDKDHARAWNTEEVARWNSPSSKIDPATAVLLVADLDNNGGLDIVASTATTSQVWLCNEAGKYNPLSAPILGSVSAFSDLEGKGLLDLIGRNAQGQPVRFVNHGTLQYHWQELRPRANPQELVTHARAVKDAHSGNPPSEEGDRRVNSFGIGGEIEARAGLLYEKQVIEGPFVHIGLGTYPEIDACRILWPNGDVRSEFSHLSKPPLTPNTEMTLLHRLKGSCPWVFAWNGRSMGFVTDFLWRSPVGLRINAQDTAGIAQTEDWVKIRGDQLAPRDGSYDIRITAELWETHFFDYVQLMSVDHPEDTEIFVDERFSVPPPALKAHILTPPKPVSRAVDDSGTDVTDIVRNLDARYLDTFGLGEYQGITRDHYVEVEVPHTPQNNAPFYLVASGWIHPTDSSINVAISQGKHNQPRGLSLEMPDRNGVWRTVKSGLGFPAGKLKTVLIRLDDVLRVHSDDVTTPGKRDSIRLRLRTNLEIYWDRLATASEVAGARVNSQRLPIQSADLRYRGYSTINQANLSSPELPDYEHMDGAGQRWRDLIGYCTRFGDVRELLRKVDDRYVIMNAGDEMALRFPVPPPPPAGWRRDFVLIGDGWEKDGDLNTAFSKTILPLPYHGQKSYNTPPGRLEDDPVVRRNPNDWKVYHTRYITPEGFRNALLPGK